MIIVTTQWRLVRAFVVATVLVIMTSGCGPEQSIRANQPATPDKNATARAYVEAHDHLAAAGEFQRLAATADGPLRQQFRLQAALSYQESGDFESAKLILADQTPQSSTSRRLMAVGQARLALENNDFEAALKQLKRTDPNVLNAYQRGVYYRIAGRAGIKTGAYRGAAKALIAAEKYPMPPAARQLLYEDTWLAVSHLEPQALLNRIEGGKPVASGWFALALIARNHLDNQRAFDTNLEQWRAHYPNHPANENIIVELKAIAASVSLRPNRIALLLPFEGRFAAAASAIRDGFITAWYGDTHSASRPMVTVYSATSQNINQVYDQAIAQGADFVVGPLQKSAVNTLYQRDDLEVSVLALNRLETNQTPQTEVAVKRTFYQFSLVPEDEARQVAEYASHEGYIRAAVLAPDTSWGKRLKSAFADRWLELGGDLSTYQYYGNESGAYARSVKQALNIDLSESRAAALRKTIQRRLEFEPRRRTDIDFIFLAGFPINARQILPQLRFFRAENLPTYSTSHVFSGKPNANDDQDLDGLIFGDMPWLYGAADLESFQAVRQSFGPGSENLRRLYALGIDAYRIIPHLGKMRLNERTQIAGTTGFLKMDEKGRIHRTLTWLRFKDGLPKLLNISALR